MHLPRVLAWVEQRCLTPSARVYPGDTVPLVQIAPGAGITEVLQGGGAPLKARDDMIYMECLSRDHLRCAAVLTAIAGPLSHGPGQASRDGGHELVGEGL